MHAIRDAGLDVPRDISVVGFDDIPEAAHFWPPLTTVRQDFAELGRRCVELLLGPTVDGERAGRRRRASCPSWSCAASTGPRALVLSASVIKPRPFRVDTARGVPGYSDADVNGHTDLSHVEHEPDEGDRTVVQSKDAEQREPVRAAASRPKSPSPASAPRSPRCTPNSSATVSSCGRRQRLRARPGRRPLRDQAAGVSYDDLAPENMILCDLDGNVIPGTPGSERAPSSRRRRARLRLPQHARGRRGRAHPLDVRGRRGRRGVRQIPCVITAMADEFGGPIPVGPVRDRSATTRSAAASSRPSTRASLTARC